MKAAVVFCVVPESDVESHDFYVKVENEAYFLFRQPWRYGVNQFFENGVRIDKTIKGTLKKYDHAVLKTIEKLPAHIKYIEKEYGIAILNQTKKKEALYA